MPDQGATRILRDAISGIRSGRRGYQFQQDRFWNTLAGSPGYIYGFFGTQLYRYPTM